MAIISCFPQGGGGNAICFKNVIVNTSDWGDSTNQAYSYEATIELNGITDNYFSIVVFDDDDDKLYHFSDIVVCGTNEITIYAKTEPTNTILIPSIACYETEVSSGVGTLEETSWDVISAIAQSGKAGDYWNIGDTKSVTINGNIGSQAYNTTLYVYIIGINHEGVNGITFQGFKKANEKNLSLNHTITYGSNTDGSLVFNMNHWGGVNYGGWKGCDLRYDILGSTDVAPSGYGAAAVSGSRVGYDATSTTVTNPVTNTLMAAFPSTLRSVMRPMTVYTDNVSTDSHNTEIGVTASVDYLPLLAEYEIFGSRTNANQYEQNYQNQYDYYANGGSKIKYNSLSENSTSSWWGRSPSYNSSTPFIRVNASGNSSSAVSYSSEGLSPIFLV